MVCECSGKYEIHWKKGSEYQRKTTRKKGRYNTKNCRCPFKLQFKYNDDEKVCFMVKVVSGYHNHPIPESLINHPYSARLNPLEKDLVHVLSKRRARPIDILSGVKVLNPQNSSSLATIYKEREKIRKKTWQEGVLMQQLLFLFEEAKYSTAYDTNEEKEVEYLFIANPECVQLARCFHQILFMDFTYKTNKYNMSILNFVGQTSTKSTFTVAFCFLKDETKESYMWALQKVKLLYQKGYTPHVLITDKEQALMWDIVRVFPYARHHFCTFHLRNNVQTNCKRVIWPENKTDMERIKNLPLEKQQEEKDKFDINDKIVDWEQLVWSLTEPLYFLRERVLMEKWSTYPDVITYLKNELLDPHKEKFVSAWVKRYTHYDNQSTSTVESAHYRFKSKLNGCDGGFVVVFEAMVEYFKRDLDRIKEDFEKSRSRKLVDYRDIPWLRGISLYVSQWAILKIITEVE
ncbi:PKS-NRPS hybrid synthetase CHGG_01239-like [Papaver somniferum]|uniref:PKS-NRPS hybrid synthetase CHGG_01239-like n=1 Tax=Papaver somniferum TaxID=3469 RepID=UPI000E7044CD|nr:PKS-NRPS hybrid synthetase CHGG_01239-like [Papaver somniferum]